jgi:hypothetical protein
MSTDPNRVIGAAQFDRQVSERLAGTIEDAAAEQHQRGPSSGRPIFDHSKEQTGTGPLELAQMTGMTSEETYFEARRNREKADEDDYAFSALARVSR